MLSLLVLTVILLCAIGGQSLFLWLGVRWARIPQGSYWKALLSVLLIGLIRIVLAPFLSALNDQYSAHWKTMVGVGWTVEVLVAWVVIQRIFRVSLFKAILAWLPTVVAVALGLAFVFLLVKPYVAEAFITPTNAMAPTLIGPHWAGTCPQCGGLLIETREVAGAKDDQIQTLGICIRCGRVSKTSVRVGAQMEAADRFICNKLLSPRRWDLVIFRSLDQQAVKHVKRVVGLPGEEVIIRDGAVWVDSSRLETPPAMGPLRFTASVQGMEGPL
jgi:signal peptidase I